MSLLTVNFTHKYSFSKCMMRADSPNSHIYSVRKETTATEQIPTSHICSTDKSKLKELPIEKTLLLIVSTDEEKQEVIIVDECYIEEDESECIQKNINKQKDSNNETEYKEYSVTHEVTIYFNILDYGRNILNRIYVTYEQACMATTKEKYYTKMLETLVNYND